jgi:protoporphyrinogen IX oxidase
MENLKSVLINSAIALLIVLLFMGVDDKAFLGWWKSFHIIMVTSWFAGLFYLPRIFVNLAMVPEGEAHKAERDRLMLMATKLFRFMTPIMVLALAAGTWIWIGYGFKGGWLHAKLLCVILLLVYHGMCYNRLEDFRRGKNSHSHVWYRWFNEIPVVLLIIVTLLVVIKPF